MQLKMYNLSKLSRKELDGSGSPMENHFSSLTKALDSISNTIHVYTHIYYY